MNSTDYLGAAEVAAYRHDGFLVVPDLLTEEEAAAFLTHEQERTEPTAFGLQGHRGDLQYRYLATHPSVVSRVRQLLDGPPRVVQTMLLSKRPQGGRGSRCTRTATTCRTSRIR